MLFSHRPNFIIRFLEGNWALGSFSGTEEDRVLGEHGPIMVNNSKTHARKVRLIERGLRALHSWHCQDRTHKLNNLGWWADCLH